ncbi:MAG TPA: hypothetical protein PK589_17095 [Nitrospira sp.]|nr:hypothetical protein [Nitrospira sp.]HNA87132.1 hypothetical protein [Nitrospira sp.]HND03641.1 hypothetical protein [Nitrospira sp.]HNE34654.1 hypothetical protein [Nitrospira sp.]HNG03651.1 hypothetical protein [Nitrospira sp.]
MGDLEQAIEERKEKVRRLEKEVDQAVELLRQAQHELEILTTARQIVTKQALLAQWEPDSPQLPLNGPVSPPQSMFHGPKTIHDGTWDYWCERYNKQYTVGEYKALKREMTLVDEVKATLCNSPAPLGPAEIRGELAKTGRVVPQNVMTGVLSRLAKENRIVREGRGKYRLPTDEEVQIQKETA